MSETIIESIGLYIIKKDTAIKYKRRYGEKPLFIFGTSKELIDVNTAEDLQFVEIFAKGHRNKQNQQLQLIKYFVSPPVLSDLLDDMKLEKNENCGAVINKYTVIINPGDLIFADECFVFVIYQKYEKEVIQKSFRSF